MSDITLPKLNRQGETNAWADVEDNDIAIRDVVNGDLDNGNLASDAAIAHSKLAAITAGRVLLGNGSNVPTATALSGDVTVNSSGVTSIAADAVGVAEIAVLPAARAATSSQTSVSNDSDVAITLGNETYDTDTMHSTVSNTSRMTIKTAGIYRFAGEINFVTPPIGTYRAAVRLNGGGDISTTRIYGDFAGVELTLPVAGSYVFSVNDYIEIVARQISGGSLNCTGKLAIDWVGPAS